MSVYEITGNVYEALYAKYIHKRPETDLIDKAGNINGKRVLDLCCGTGRLLKECVRRGAIVKGVDNSPEMISEMRKECPEIFITCRGVRVELIINEIINSQSPDPQYDVVFCRQAVNYWIDADLAKNLAEMLNPGGKFIFNTFNKKPSETPVVKEYDFDGHHFVEVSWLVGETVHHIQVRDGLDSHTTSFKWIPTSEFLRMLTPHFDVEVEQDGATTIFVCSKKA